MNPEQSPNDEQMMMRNEAEVSETSIKPWDKGDLERKISGQFVKDIKRTANDLFAKKERNEISEEEYNQAMEGLDRVCQKSLNKKTSEVLYATVDEAFEIMGDNIFAQSQIEKKFGIKVDPENYPEMPFSAEELERAKQLGQQLILRTDKDNVEDIISLSSLVMLVRSQNPLDILDHKISEETFYHQDKLEKRWALVTSDIIPNSEDKNYFEQTRQIKEYLGSYGSDQMPPGADMAIREFDEWVVKNYPGHDDEMGELMRENKRLVKELVDLKINQLFRQNPVEALYDMIITDLTDEISEVWWWTNRYNNAGEPIEMGFDMEVNIKPFSAEFRDRSNGVIFARKK